MNATVTECGTVLDWLWAVGEKVGKGPQPKSSLPVPNRKVRDLERDKKEQIPPRRSAPCRNDKISKFEQYREAWEWVPPNKNGRLAAAVIQLLKSLSTT